MAARINSDNPEVLRYAFNYYVENKADLVLKGTLEKYLECEVNEAAKSEMCGDFEAYFGKYKKAVEYYKKATLIAPTNSDVIKKLKKAKYNSGFFAISFRISLRILEYIFAGISLCVSTGLIILGQHIFTSIAIGFGVYIGLTAIIKVRTLIE